MRYAVVCAALLVACATPPPPEATAPEPTAPVLCWDGAAQRCQEVRLRADGTEAGRRFVPSVVCVERPVCEVVR